MIRANQSTPDMITKEEPMRFRKKPIEIDAIQMPTKDGDFSRAPEWVVSAMAAGVVGYPTPGTFAVQTEEGLMTGQAGDFLIKGIVGELYPCKREIFIATYERVGSAAPLLGS